MNVIHIIQTKINYLNNFHIGSLLDKFPLFFPDIFFVNKLKFIIFPVFTDGWVAWLHTEN
jgi:hypothetical protein